MSKYIQDLSVDLGVELVTNGTFDTDILNWTYIGTYGEAIWDNGSIKVTGNQSDKVEQIINLGAGIYVFTYKQIVNSGEGCAYVNVDGTSIHNGLSLPSGTYSIVFNAISVVKIWCRLNSEASDINFDNISLREATAYEINNYTESARLDNQLKGSSNLLVETDASGRAIGVMPPNTIWVG